MTRRIELGSDPAEEDIEINSDVLDFMRLKYASMILGGLKEDSKKILLDNNFFTEEDSLRLENLTTEFARRGLTYGNFFRIINAQDPKIIQEIEKEMISKKTTIMQTANKFD